MHGETVKMKYIVISFAVLWQHVFQVVLCVCWVLCGVQSHTAQHTAHTPQPETHTATTLQNL